MSLLLVDLDDTLIDRTAAVRAWLEGFIGDVGAPISDVDYLLDIDAGARGLAVEFARTLQERYGLGRPIEDIAEDIRAGVLDGIELTPADRQALEAVRAAGWSTVVVTNGGVASQERKIRSSGIDQLVDGWIVSAAVDVWKPDPLIFELAAKRAGRPLADAWMIGDNPEADIAGAHNAGISSVWLHHGRPWPDLPYRPTRSADSCADAIRSVLADG
ncbi:HAD family hydrolase [Phytoactinopolyspora halotolerans]|uniref:HAD family hydrolase n=1 Tax=Phytoactinopolyspora halotolerans TaxID=1981512 RepID=A0A6L9S459_9ACTN|nr:HAD family hydrolase [Phytoactinopolyspora halotolerans]NED98779.1 HAD family hydrolase [Phytoactinopolyspora halotolerans]